MAQSCESEQPQDDAQPLLPFGHRRPYRRRIHLRRRKLPKARLGGKRPPRVVAFWRSFRDIQIRKWLMRVRCTCLVKKLNPLFGKGIAGAGAGAVVAFQKRILLEISLAVPVLGASLL